MEESDFSSSPPGDPLAAVVGAGVKLGDYEILKRLAAGGMAEIYLARVQKLTFQKMVVIKRILPQLAQNSEFVEMFLDEARIAATLEHPNIVQTYDVGVIDGSYYIAMEYLHGEDVRGLMKALAARERKLPLDLALNIIISIAGGLHYAHSKVGFDGQPLEIVHRDVSPQNLIVTYEGGVKLLDFGIAKASNRLRETRVGTLKGKVPYMSPEQCRSEALDRRSDIYSLGILLYELTLSKRLYTGTSDFEVLKEIVEGKVKPPSEIDPNYPPALEAIVMRALEKQIEHRWPTAREMQVELELFVRQRGLHATATEMQAFMEQLFGSKIEAWREARAQGKTLGEHLLTVEHEYVDSDTGQLRGSDAERVRAERAAFLASLDAKKSLRSVSGFGSHPGSGVGSRPGGSLGSSSVPRLKAETKRGPLLAVAAVFLLVVLLLVRLDWLPHTQPTVTTVVTQPSTQETASAGAGMREPPSVTTKSVPAPPPPAPEPVAAPKPAAPSPPIATRAPAPPPPPRKVVGKPKHPGGASAALPHLPAAAAPPPTAAAPAPRPAPPSPSPSPAETPAPAAKLEGSGTLMVASSPWCHVAVDGQDRGVTPLQVKLPAGPHTLTVTNPEFKITRSYPVVIQPDETLRKRLDFAY